MALTAGDRIRNLLGLYAERLDAGDFAGVGELFARGALAAEDGEPFVRGAADVAAFYAASTQLHDGAPRTRHLVSGTILDDPAADGTITARSSYVVFQGTDGFPLQPIITGRYVDRFAPDDVGGDWHFVERRFWVDHLGDLSQHLVDPSIADRP